LSKNPLTFAKLQTPPKIVKL